MQEFMKSGYFNFHCDGCTNAVDTRQYEFNRAIKAIKESGWIIKKAGEEWRHFCSQDCVDNWIKNGRK